MTTKHKFILLPSRHIKVGGKKRASLGFKTKKAARSFVNKRGLKGAVLLGRRR